MAVLDRAMNNGERSDEVHGALMEMASLGGISISNVRTGNIHEAAGALLELTNLSHPETLFVFFREVVRQYLVEIRDHEERLVSSLRLIPAFAQFTSLEDVISWWEQLFVKVGLDSKIRDSIARLKPNIDKARDHIFQRVYSDKVWITKESPLILDEKLIMLFIDRSLDRFSI